MYDNLRFASSNEETCDIEQDSDHFTIGLQFSSHALGLGSKFKKLKVQEIWGSKIRLIRTQARRLTSQTRRITGKKNITHRKQQGYWGRRPRNHTGLHWWWWHQDISCRGPWDQLWLTCLWIVWPHSKWWGILDYQRWTSCMMREKLETQGSIQVEECWKSSEFLRLGGGAPASCPYYA